MNLLNPERIQKIADATLLRIVVRTGTVVTLIIAVTTVALTGIHMMLGQRLKEVQSELARTQVVSPTGASLPVQETTKRINRRLGLINSLLAPSFLEERVQAVAEVLPDGIRLSQLAYSHSTQRLTLGGKAESRSAIPSLQSGLDGLEFIQSFSIASDINQRTDIAFTVEVVLKNSERGSE